MNFLSKWLVVRRRPQGAPLTARHASISIASGQYKCESQIGHRIRVASHRLPIAKYHQTHERSNDEKSRFPLVGQTDRHFLFAGPFLSEKGIVA